MYAHIYFHTHVYRYTYSIYPVYTYILISEKYLPSLEKMKPFCLSDGWRKNHQLVDCLIRKASSFVDPKFHEKIEVGTKSQRTPVKSKLLARAFFDTQGFSGSVLSWVRPLEIS